MAVNSSIAAENHRKVGLFQERGPFSAGKALKVSQRSRHISRPYDSSGAHAQEIRP